MAISFDDIQNANNAIKLTDIKGKPYAKVNERVKAFRMLYPMGTIETEVLAEQGGKIVIRARVLDGDRLLGTGMAYEKEGSTFINKTSYIENCETSAVGRALGFAGFGIDTSIASFEEVTNAIEQQKGFEKITTVMAKSFDDRCGGDKDLKAFMLKGMGVSSFADLTNDNAKILSDGWNNFVKQYKESKK